MSTSEDVANLFRKFGGTPEQYQELSRDSRAEESRARWPLLAALRLAEPTVAPSVRDGRQPVAGAPVPHLQGREQVAGMSPFAPVPEVTREQVREALLDAPSNVPPNAQPRTHADGPGFFRAAPPSVPAGARGGERGLARLRAAGGASVAPAAAADTADTAVAPSRSLGVLGALGALKAAASSGAAVADAMPASAAVPDAAAPERAPRALSTVFAKLAAEPASGAARAPQKNALFARLSRL